MGLYFSLLARFALSLPPAPFFLDPKARSNLNAVGTHHSVTLETKGLDLDATKALFESDAWAYELDRTGSRGVEEGGGSYTAVGRTSSEEPGEERGRRAEGEDAEIG